MVTVYTNHDTLKLTKQQLAYIYKLNSLRMSKKYIHPSIKRSMKCQTTVSQREKFVESNFVPVARISEIPVGKMKMVKFLDREILIANVNGNYYAIGNKCTHAGGDLSQSTLEGNVVTCQSTIQSLTSRLAKWLRLRKLDFFTLRYMTNHLTR